MFALPFIDNNGESQTFGSEFDQMYRLELNQNLQSPLEEGIDYNTGSKFTLYDSTDGIFNQAKLFENNDDPKEDQQMTDQQALSRIRNTAGINRPLTESEQRFNLYTDDNFDIRFRDQLLRESVRGNDNLFSEFSQDHVNSIRQSNTNQNREENLYDAPATQASQLLTAMGNMGNQVPGILDKSLDELMRAAGREQQQQRESQSFRDRQMPKTKPTMNQRFEERMRGRPTFTPPQSQPVDSTPDSTFPRRFVPPLVKRFRDDL